MPDWFLNFLVLNINNVVEIIYFVFDNIPTVYKKKSKKKIKKKKSAYLSCKAWAKGREGQRTDTAPGS